MNEYVSTDELKRQRAVEFSAEDLFAAAQAIAVLASKIQEMKRDRGTAPMPIRRNSESVPPCAADGLSNLIERAEYDLSRAIDRWRSEMRKSARF